MYAYCCKHIVVSIGFTIVHSGKALAFVFRNSRFYSCHLQLGLGKSIVHQELNIFSVCCYMCVNYSDLDGQVIFR